MRSKLICTAFKELNSKPLPLTCVPIYRLVKLKPRLIAEYDRQRHDSILRIASAFTDSHGVTASGRAMLSANRRSNSTRCTVRDRRLFRLARRFCKWLRLIEADLRGSNSTGRVLELLGP